MVKQNWTTWLQQQTPLALAIGAVYASVFAFFRSLKNAQWRKSVPKATDKQIQKTLDNMSLWTENKTTKIEDLKIRLGVDKHTNKPFDIPVMAFAAHTYIDGPSGKGKTTDIIQIIRGMIENPNAQKFKIPLIFINMKPEKQLSEIVKQCAVNGGRKFWHITETGTTETTYNPIKNGSAEHARNILVGAEEFAANGGFSEPYYWTAGQRLTLLAIKALDDLIQQKETYVRGGERFLWTRDFYHVSKLMIISILENVKDKLTPKIFSDVREFLAEVEENKDLRKAGDGMRQRFARAAEGAAGAVLQEKTGGLCLKQAILNGDVVLFDLDADRDQDAAQQIGNLAIQDLSAVFAQLGEQKWQQNSKGETDRLAMVIVNEFPALGGAHLK